MTRFRDLPGGIDRADYLWPMMSVIHPEHGSYRMDVHCIRDSQSGAMSLVAFSGYVKPNSPERRRRIDMVADVARGVGNVIQPINENDISGDIALRLAAQFHAKPRYRHRDDD